MRRRASRVFVLTIVASSSVACTAILGDFSVGGGGDDTPGGDGSTGTDGTIGSDGNVTGDGASSDGSADGAAGCGYPGEACCVAPLAPCNQGTACVSNVCRANDIWAVGYYLENIFGPPVGLTLHYDGTSWTRGPDILLHGSDTQYPTAVWGTAPDSYVAVTTEGKADEYLGGSPASWRECGSVACANPGTSQSLWSIFGFSFDDYWIGGSNVMYHCSLGGSCVSTTTGLSGTWGQGTFTGTSSNDLWYPQFSRAFHYDGGAWGIVNGLHANAMWEHTPTDIWSADTVIQHFDGSSWQTYAFTKPDGGAPGSIYAMHGTAADDVWAVGQGSSESFAGHWDGTSWTYHALPPIVNNYPNGVFAVSKTEAYVIASFSPIMKWDGTSWTAMTMPVYDAGVGTTTGSWSGIFGSARPRP